MVEPSPEPLLSMYAGADGGGGACGKSAQGHTRWTCTAVMRAASCAQAQPLPPLPQLPPGPLLPGLYSTEPRPHVSAAYDPAGQAGVHCALMLLVEHEVPVQLLQGTVVYWVAVGAVHWHFTARAWYDVQYAAGVTPAFAGRSQLLLPKNW